MIKVIIQNYSLVVADENGAQYVIFNGEDAIHNYSLIPLWKYNDCKIAIEYLLDIFDEYIEKSKGVSVTQISDFIIGCLLADRIKSNPKYIFISCFEDNSEYLNFMISNVCSLFGKNSLFFLDKADKYELEEGSMDVAIVSAGEKNAVNDDIIKYAFSSVGTNGTILIKVSNNNRFVFDMLAEYPTIDKLPVHSNEYILIINRSKSDVNENEYDESLFFDKDISIKIEEAVMSGNNVNKYKSILLQEKMIRETIDRLEYV